MFAYKDVQRAFTDGRWKLIRYPLVDKTQLFDLQSDPFEITNLAGRPEQASKVIQITRQLSAEMEHSGDKARLVVLDSE